MILLSKTKMWSGISSKPMPGDTKQEAEEKRLPSKKIPFNLISGRICFQLDLVNAHDNEKTNSNDSHFLWTRESQSFCLSVHMSVCISSNFNESTTTYLPF